MIGSTCMNSQVANLLNVAGTPVYSYSATPTSIQIQIPASTYTYSDNVHTVSVPAYNNTFSGLTATTLYYFDIAVDSSSGTFFVSNPSTSKFNSQQQLTDCFRDGRVNIQSNYQVQTPTSGTSGGSSGGGGGGGSSCPAANQLMKTKERGFIRAEEIEVGMHVPSFQGGDSKPWVRVVSVDRKRAPIWRYSLKCGESNMLESFEVNSTHAVLNVDGEWEKVCDLKPGMELKGALNSLVVVSAEYLRDDDYIPMEVEGHIYSMGCGCVHNPITL